MFDDEIKKLLEERDELLSQYEKLYHSVLKLGSSLHDFNDKTTLSSNESDLQKWNELMVCELSKITRLIVALLYVENPNDPSIVSGLFENVAINNMDEEVTFTLH